MAQLLLADYMQQRSGGLGAAGDAQLAAAEALGLEGREALYLAALRATADSDPPRALQAWTAAVHAFPGDHFAVKRGQFIGYIAGDAAGMVTIAKAATPGKYLPGMLSFALEQTGELAAAEAVARAGLAALEKEPGTRDGWLEHALAHCLYFQGRSDEAVAFLQDAAKSWKREEMHPFLFTHNWWHLALVLVETGRADEALRIYDEQLWRADKSDPEVQINALGLLLRLGVRGRPQVERCAEVAAAMRGQPYLHVYPLHNLLRMWCLCVIKEDATELLDGLRATAEQSREAMPHLLDKVLPLALALRDLHASDAGAKDRIAALRGEDNWKYVAGSLEQRGFLSELTDGPLLAGKPARPTPGTQ